jgi:uncharacterized membrane protein
MASRLEQRLTRSKGDGGGVASAGRVKNSHIIEEHIDVGVPTSVAYDQWTQYGEWSKIFKKEEAKQGRDRKGDGRRTSRSSPGEGRRKVTVQAKIGPSRRQWEAEVVEQAPGSRIVWRAKGGVQAKGVVTFHRLDERLTHLRTNIEYKPSGLIETIGNFFRMPRRRVRKDLKLFKNFIELRGEATGRGPGRLEGQGLRPEMDAQVEQASKDSDQHGSDHGHQGGRRDNSGDRHQQGEE